MKIESEGSRIAKLSKSISSCELVSPSFTARINCPLSFLISPISSIDVSRTPSSDFS
ncbi:hypothetical protein DPMN_118750 [Dreissena polymorpha]|uniref:Uncharacterized protein n=1 Tax=Dreissena polymorpha TaxID=45954 RepID=A0A9D4JQJ4_DREPO|nr:hypothetical protein DPMN_118750 [Dreissena polymorpha]